MYLRRRRLAAVGAGQREPAAGTGRRAGRAPAPGQRLQRPAPDPRRADRERAAARRGPADRADRHAGSGTCAGTRSPAPRACGCSTASATTSSPRPTRRCWRASTRTTGPPSTGRCSAPWPARTSSRSRRGSRASDGQWIWTRGRGRGAPRRGRRGAWRSRAPTRTSPRPSSPRSRSRTRSSRTPSCRRSPAPPTRRTRSRTCSVQARSLVLLHDDWERARAFVLADGRGRGGAALRPARRPSGPTTRRPTATAMELELANRAFPANDAGVGRAAAHHRLPDPVRRRGVRRRHDHVGAPALPPRADPDDGRAGGRPARPGGRAPDRRSASWPTPATARWRRRGRSRSSWRP